MKQAQKKGKGRKKGGAHDAKGAGESGGAGGGMKKKKKKKKKNLLNYLKIQNRYHKQKNQKYH